MDSMNLTAEQRKNALTNSNKNRHQPPKTLANQIDWDTAIANLKAMLNRIDQAERRRRRANR